MYNHLLPKKNGGVYKVLVAEDQEVNQMMISLIFTKLGCEFDLARDGSVAFDLFQRNRYDIVFLDCVMPVMNGLDACRQIREFENTHNQFRTPIVALTGNISKAEQQQCFDAGMDAHIAKPARIEKISDVINYFCSGSAEPKQIFTSNIG